MTKRIFALVLFWAFTVLPVEGAQKVYRIGALIAADQFLPAFEGFKMKMAALGYKEGENIRYDLHNANGDREALNQLALKLVQDKPDLIVTSSTTATAPVAKATKGTDLPVVFLSAGNPLQFVKGYASSGNNLTGITSSSLDLIDKRLELLKELAPGAKRVIALQVPGEINYEDARRLTREAAKKLGLALVEVQAGHEEIKTKTSDLITRKLGDGVLIP
ncbi:MAG: ABC transporter substrate-binding protein, partial [Candidatus Binatia bacterium]